MAVPGLTRYVSNGVTLLGDTARPGGVTLAFTERTGGCSTGRFSSLNLSLDCDDDEKSVRANRERVMGAIGAGADAGRLVSPRQVHGDRLVVVDDGSDEAVARLAADAREGADGVVCCVPGVPVLLCYADCVPVVLVQHGAFAVVHSGWRGTRARIAARISSKTQGLPSAPLPIINPSQPVSRIILIALSASVISPLPTTGTEICCFTEATQPKSAFPLYI